MNESHTPGPWRLDESYSLCIHFGRMEGGIAIHKDTPNGLANARLIAAAPDLLKAAQIGLSYITSEYGSDKTDYDFVLNTIKKALFGS